MKPFIKVKVTEVTEDDGKVYTDFENHVHASISFDGEQEFNMFSIRLIHGNDDPTPKEIEQASRTIERFTEVWRCHAAAIGVEFIFDAESEKEYLESFKGDGSPPYDAATKTGMYDHD